MSGPGLRRGNRDFSQRLRVAGLILVGLLVLAGCASEDGLPGGGGSTEAPDLPDLTDCPAPTGQPAVGEQTLPKLSLACLDEDGGVLTIGQAPGVAMVLNLWASWCGPCREELPYFGELSAAADPGQLLVAGVVTRDSPGLAAELAVDLGIGFPSGVDENGDLYVDQGLRGLPGTFFVNADGSIAHAELAPITSYDDLLALVQDHLGVTV